MAIRRLIGVICLMTGSAVSLTGVLRPHLTNLWSGLDVDPVLFSVGAAIAVFGLAQFTSRRGQPSARAFSGL